MTTANVTFSQLRVEDQTKVKLEAAGELITTAVKIGFMFALARATYMFLTGINGEWVTRSISYNDDKTIQAVSYSFSPAVWKAAGAVVIGRWLFG
jgi:hypothetical protein